MRGVGRGTVGWQASAIVLAAVIGVCGAQADDKPKAPTSIWEQDKLTGDWGGARTALKDRGIDITLNYVGEALDVVSGGLFKRPSYEGRAEFSVDADLEKLIGWTGGMTHVTVFGIHNAGYTAVDHAGSISDPSNIDAYHTVRLFTAWFQQGDPDKDLISVRFGQLAADDEFFTSETAGGLINGTFGWGDLLAANITNGGPAYPLATPGVRVKVNPTPQLGVLAAVFSGDPAGRDCFDDAQRCNAHGTTFSLTGGALWLGEMQYRVNQGKQAIGLPGVYKVGGWYATADYADQHLGIDPATGAILSLADPAMPDPLFRSGNWGIYGVADQMVWRGPASSVNLFVRGGGSPSDRNLVSYYIDGGAGLKGLLPGRPDDTLTFGVAYAKISRDAVALDRDTLAINGPPYAIRDEEVVFELSYAAQVAPWWTVQPDLQYIVHPNGGQNANDPTLTVGHAFIAGVRSIMKF
jgi:porin